MDLAGEVMGPEGKLRWQEYGYIRGKVYHMESILFFITFNPHFLYSTAGSGSLLFQLTSSLSLIAISNKVIR